MKLAELKAAVDAAYENCYDPEDTVVVFSDSETFEQRWPDITCADLHENGDEDEPELFVLYIKENA